MIDRLYYKIKNYGLLRHIKWAYQRVVRGYDDTVCWNFDRTLSIYIEPLKQFCVNEIAFEKKSKKMLNPKRVAIFEKTIELIDKHKEAEQKRNDNFSWETDRNEMKALENMWEYIGKNIATYWY